MPDVTILDETTEVDAPANEDVHEELLEGALLVEDVSIDGMCGVY
jgi:mycofactocin precursor